MNNITDNYPRVLVISHNPFSSVQNNGKTLSAFFKGWPKENLAQLFLTLDEFDTQICNKFYKITDLEVLKRFINHKKECGSTVKESDVNLKEKEKLHKNKLYTLIRDIYKSRSSLAILIRNFVWNRVKPWKLDDLNNWISEFKPDIIFFQTSNVYAIFNMVEYISNKYNLPIIMETTDDYVTQKFSLNPFYNIDILNMKRVYKNMVSKSKCVFAIGDKMAKEYQERFGGNFKVAMNTINIDKQSEEYDIINDNFVFTYAGNLGLNRWQILHELGKSLYRIKQKNGINSKLNIYSLDKPKKSILDKLNCNSCISYCGSISTQELEGIRNKSDFLVHVESFDKKNMYITRLSVSTKIPEYLLSKRCILGIGPQEVASIQYLQNNKIGKVITDIKSDELDKELLDIMTNDAEILEYIKNGNEIVKKNHIPEQITERVQSEIINSVKGKNNEEIFQ